MTNDEFNSLRIGQSVRVNGSSDRELIGLVGVVDMKTEHLGILEIGATFPAPVYFQGYDTSAFMFGIHELDVIKDEPLPLPG